MTRRVTLALTLASCFVTASAFAIGEATRVEIRGIEVGGEEARPTARRRLAWEVRKRTSIETRLQPRRARLDDPSIFETPMLYWSGAEGFDPLGESEIVGLRRFVEFGGMVVIDDADPESDAFDRSIRRALRRAFPEDPLRPLPSDHTVYRSFYLLDRPVGRVRGPATLDAIQRSGRAAVVYTRHDLGGAWARDNLGTWQHTVVPGGDGQRERAIRLGVNLVMYALCLDYKDDQVHAPFIMRRRAGMP